MEFQRIKIEDKDALPLLNEVKFRFGEGTKYEAALQCIKNLQSERPDIHKEMHIIISLFHEHPDLIVAFNTLLPLDAQIKVHFKEQDESDVLQNNTHCSKETLQPQVGITRASEFRFLRIGDSLAFLARMKATCDANTYNSFLNIMKDYRNRKLTVQGAVSQTTELLHEHPDLIEAFSQFLPPGYQIHPSAMDNASPGIEQVPVCITEDLGHHCFTDAMKQKYDAATYKSFLEAVYAFHCEKLMPHDVIKKIEIVLQDHPVLLAGFRQFVPANWDTHPATMCDLSPMRNQNNVENMMKNMKLN